VFSLQAIAALSSGYLLLSMGWMALVYTSALVLVSLCALLLHRWRQSLMAGAGQTAFK